MSALQVSFYKSFTWKPTCSASKRLLKVIYYFTLIKMILIMLKKEKKIPSSFFPSSSVWKSTNHLYFSCVFIVFFVLFVSLRKTLAAQIFPRVTSSLSCHINNFYLWDRVKHFIIFIYFIILNFLFLQKNPFSLPPFNDWIWI